MIKLWNLFPLFTTLLRLKRTCVPWFSHWSFDIFQKKTCWNRAPENCQNIYRCRWWFRWMPINRNSNVLNSNSSWMFGFSVKKMIVSIWKIATERNISEKKRRCIDGVCHFSVSIYRVENVLQHCRAIWHRRRISTHKHFEVLLRISLFPQLSVKLKSSLYFRTDGCSSWVCY